MNPKEIVYDKILDLAKEVGDFFSLGANRKIRPTITELNSDLISYKWSNYIYRNSILLQGAILPDWKEVI